MKISKETKLCISIAARPGNFGTTFFNRAFVAHDFDCIYKAMRCEADADLKSILQTIRDLGIRGCGVSMPFKEKIVPFLDRLGTTAEKTKAVNTIVNDEGVLTGHNTDYSGSFALLKNLKAAGKEVLVCGSGGVARALVLALIDLKAKVFVSARDPQKLKRFVKDFPAISFDWKNLEEARGFLLVNATPVGMFPEADRSVVSANVVKRFEAVLDVVAHPYETLLIQAARKEGKEVFTGKDLALAQAMAQFRLYAGKELSKDEAESFCD